MCPSGPARVLVADDDPSVRSLLAAVVRHLELEPVIAGGAAAAVELLETQQVAAAVVDPATDGSSVISDLLAVQPSLEGRIIVVSTRPQEKSAGVAAVLRKPFHLQDLRDALRDCCIR